MRCNGLVSRLCPELLVLGDLQTSPSKSGNCFISGIEHGRQLLSTLILQYLMGESTLPGAFADSSKTCVASVLSSSDDKRFPHSRSKTQWLPNGCLTGFPSQIF